MCQCEYLLSAQGLPTRGTNRGSERQSVSHPASGCLRGKDQTQEGRDPQGTDPHRGRPHRGRPTHRGIDPHKGRDPHRRHTDSCSSACGLCGSPRAEYSGFLLHYWSLHKIAKPASLRDAECAAPCGLWWCCGMWLLIARVWLCEDLFD